MTIDELKALYAKATPGPWIAVEEGMILIGSDEIEDGTFLESGDAEIIAAMHAMLPKLIDVAEAASERREDCTCGSGPRAPQCGLCRTVDALEGKK